MLVIGREYGFRYGYILPLRAFLAQALASSDTAGSKVTVAELSTRRRQLCTGQPTQLGEPPRRGLTDDRTPGTPIVNRNPVRVSKGARSGVYLGSLSSPWAKVGAHSPPARTTSPGSAFGRRDLNEPSQLENPPTPRHTLELQNQRQRQQERAQRAGLPPPPPATGKGGRGNLMLSPESDSHRFVLHVRDLTKQGNLPGVLAALTIAERRAGGVDVGGYKACIDGMAKVRRWGDALALLSRMRVAGVAPDSRCYTSAIEACCRSGQYGHVLALRREMVSVGLTPTPRCYRLELEHLGNSGRWREALELLSEVKGAGITPDAKMYNSVLDAFARSSEWQKAADVMRDMEREGHELHARSYRGVVVAAANAGDWRTAWRYFKKMVSSGVRKSSRSPVIFSSVAVVCGAAGKWKEALETLRLAARQGITPTRIAYNATLGAMGKAGGWQEAQRLLNEMRHRSSSARWPQCSGAALSERVAAAPDVYSYTSVIDAFAKAGELERALRILEDMRHAQVRPSLATLNALVSACRSGGQWRRALAIVEEMRRSGIEPDDQTLTLIVAACEARGEWEEVASSLTEGVAAGDGFLARVSILAHARAGKWRAGSEVVRVMKASGTPGDVGVYNALIESLVARPPSRA